MSKTVVGIFDNYNYAESAARQIKDQGLRTADISIVARQGDTDNTGTAAGTTATMGNAGTTATMGNNRNTGTNTTAKNDNISDGVITGGILGGLAGLLIGAGSMIIPGLGIVAAAGPITGLLSGAVTRGIVGGLVDLGIPENRSRQYETDINAGKIVSETKLHTSTYKPLAQEVRRGTKKVSPKPAAVSRSTPSPAPVPTPAPAQQPAPGTDDVDNPPISTTE